MHKSKGCTADWAGEIPSIKGRYIMCFQEPHVFRGNLKGWPTNTRIIFKKSSKIRACILVKEEDDVWFCPDLSNGDICTVMTKVDPEDTKETLISSIYMDINNNKVIPELLNGLVRVAANQGRELIICADTVGGWITLPSTI